MYGGRNRRLSYHDAGADGREITCTLPSSWPFIRGSGHWALHPSSYGGGRFSAVFMFIPMQVLKITSAYHESGSRSLRELVPL